MVQKYSQLTKTHQLIKKQIKGTPEEIANLLGMSKSSMYRVFEELEQLGQNINIAERVCVLNTPTTLN